MSGSAFNFFGAGNNMYSDSFLNHFFYEKLEIAIAGKFPGLRELLDKLEAAMDVGDPHGAFNIRKEKA